MNFNHDARWGYAVVPEYYAKIKYAELKIDDPDHNAMVIEEQTRKSHEYFKSLGLDPKFSYKKSSDYQPNTWVVNEVAIPS